MKVLPYFNNILRLCSSPCMSEWMGPTEAQLTENTWMYPPVQYWQWQHNINRENCYCSSALGAHCNIIPGRQGIAPTIEMKWLLG